MVEVKLRQSCPSGLTESDLEWLFGNSLPEFNYWMRGQTMSVCDGARYSHKKQAYYSTSCARWEDYPVEADIELPDLERSQIHGHGVVAYIWDVERYLLGRPIVD